MVILDLDMPIMNGFEACTRIRNNDAKESIRELLGFGGSTNKHRGNQLGGPIIDSAHKQDDEIPKERLFIVALSGLITEAVVDRGQKCGFDEFSKFLSKYLYSRSTTYRSQSPRDLAHSFAEQGFILMPRTE